MLWTWTAVAYHVIYFSDINRLAYVFAAVFLIGAALFLWHGVLRRNLAFAWRQDAFHYAGAAQVVYALVVYPAWNHFSGHAYPETPTFGLPCPSTLYTVGMLCMTGPSSPRSPLWMPILWCLVGGQAAILPGILPDFGLFAAVLVALALALRLKRGGAR